MHTKLNSGASFVVNSATSPQQVHREIQESTQNIINFNKQQLSGGAGSLEGSFQSALDAANAANKERLAEIRGLLQSTGDQERQDIRQRFSELGTTAGQNLVSRGLSSSTVAPTVQAGIAREETSAVGRLEDRLRLAEAGLLERVEETGPDFGFLAQLAQLQGRGGAFGSLGGSRTSKRKSQKIPLPREGEFVPSEPFRTIGPQQPQQPQQPGQDVDPLVNDINAEENLPIGFFELDPLVNDINAEENLPIGFFELDEGLNSDFAQFFGSGFGSGIL